MSGRVEYRHGESPDALRNLKRGCAAAIVADPPYGLGEEYGRRKDDGGRWSIAHDTDLSALAGAAEDWPRILSPLGVVVVFMAPTMRRKAEFILEGVGLCVVGYAPWDKQRPGISYGIRYAYEDAIIACRYGAGDPFEQREPLVVPIRDGSLWTSGRPNEHPNEKPVRMLRRLIAWACPEGGLVVDPFAGIASCGVAAIAQRCDYVGVECDPRWWPIAERRLAEARGRNHDALPQQSLFGDTEAA